MLYPTRLQVFNCNLTYLDGLTTTQQNTSDFILKNVPKQEWSKKGMVCKNIKLIHDLFCHTLKTYGFKLNKGHQWGSRHNGGISIGESESNHQITIQ